MGFEIEIVGQPNMKLLVNGKTFVLNDSGYTKIDSDLIKTIENKSISEFDLEIDKLITQEQKKNLYLFFINSTRFGIIDLADLLQIEKNIIRNTLIPLMIKYSVCIKHETQWKVNRETKEYFKNILKSIHYHEHIKDIAYPYLSPSPSLSSSSSPSPSKKQRRK